MTGFENPHFETVLPIVWKEHIGEKADIVDGEVVLDPNGFLTVSTDVAPYNALVQGNQIIPLCPKDEYRGRQYRPMRSDCVTLAAQWMDAYRGTDMIASVRAVGRRQYQTYAQLGYEDAVRACGFEQAQDAPAHADVVLYGVAGHIGIVIDSDKILHHPVGKLSCIDRLDMAKVLKVYRYAR